MARNGRHSRDGSCLLCGRFGQRR